MPQFNTMNWRTALNCLTQPEPPLWWAKQGFQMLQFQEKQHEPTPVLYPCHGCGLDGQQLECLHGQNVGIGQSNRQQDHLLPRWNQSLLSRARLSVVCHSVWPIPLHFWQQWCGQTTGLTFAQTLFGQHQPNVHAPIKNRQGTYWWPLGICGSHQRFDCRRITASSSIGFSQHPWSRFMAIQYVIR